MMVVTLKQEQWLLQVQSYYPIQPSQLIKYHIKITKIWAGNPAKYLRDMKASEKVNISEHRNELQELASVCAEETEKPTTELLNDEDYRYTQWFTSQEDVYMSEISQFGNFTSGTQDDFGIEGNLEGYV
jgi:hypothetical protein